MWHNHRPSSCPMLPNTTHQPLAALLLRAPTLVSCAARGNLVPGPAVGGLVASLVTVTVEQTAVLEVCFVCVEHAY